MKNYLIQKRTIRLTVRELLFVAVLTIILIIKNVFWTGMPNILFTAIVALFLILATEDERFCMIAFCIPFHSGLPMTEILAIYIVIAVFLEKRRHFHRSLFIGICMICILNVLGNMLYAESSLRSEITILVFFIASAVLVNRDFEDEDLLKAAFLFCVGVIISFSIISCVSIRASSLSQFLSGRIRFGKTIKYVGYEYKANMILSYNTNQTGQLCAVAIAMCMAILDNRIIKNWQKTMMIIAYMVFGYMTLSRAFLLALGIIVVWFVLFAKRTEGISATKKIGTLLLLFTALLIVLSIMPVEIYQSFLARMDTDDLSNGRASILQSELIFLSENPRILLMGAGNSGYVTLLEGIPSHNMIAEVLLSWGLIGLGALIGLLVYIYHRHLRGKVSKYKLLPFIVMLTTLQFGQFASNKMAMIILFACLLSARKQEERKLYEYEKASINYSTCL